MITHEIKIGQKIFDTYDNRWGVVLLINGEEKDRIIFRDEDDTIILYKPEDSVGECETLARNAYPLVENLLFLGEEVCTEINRDEFSLGHDYDYYCPGSDVNLWDFEVSEK